MTAQNDRRHRIFGERIAAPFLTGRRRLKGREIPGKGASMTEPQITEDGIPDVDLSAIRQQISEEVQRIYEDDQNS